MKKKVKGIVYLGFLGVFFMYVNSVYSHCEIPCGIYGDETRIILLREHITTVEKSMKQIITLSGEGHKNSNQLVRWITNKEKHASLIQEIVSQYFITQRIKPVDKKDKKNYTIYIDQLTLLHKMIIFAMKAKQTTDLKNIDTLRSLVTDFEKLYLAYTHKK